MKTTLEENLASASGSMRMTASKALKQSITSIRSLCLVAGITATLASFSQTTGGSGPNTPRVITSTTGETLPVKLIDKTADSVEVIRLSDSKRIKIPLDRICEADRTMIAAWDPTPTQSYRPSSVSIAGSSTIQKKSYPSFCQPRYSGTASAGRSQVSQGGGCKTYRKSCTKRTVTVIAPSNCPNRTAPCPNRTVTVVTPSPCPKRP